jgi:hypothetical protein
MREYTDCSDWVDGGQGGLVEGLACVLDGVVNASFASMGN